VHKARRDGVGCDCDVALFDAALSQLNYVATWVASRDHEPERQPLSAHPSIVPFQAVEASDGWLAIACAKEVFWERLCLAAGREDLLADPRYSGMDNRRVHRRELTAELATTFASRPVNDWLEKLERLGVPAGRVNSVADALREGQVEHRAMVEQYDHPMLGTARHVGPAVRVGDRRRPVRRAPFRGEHTDQLLAKVGDYAATEIAALRGSGACRGCDGGQAQ
jgi:crotonobetainyl-CoA:carnitine CoA-transferase CaiB-like acyl-CoA transferase